MADASAAVMHALFDSDSDEPPAQVGQDEAAGVTAGALVVRPVVASAPRELGGEAEQDKHARRGGAASSEPPLYVELPRLPAAAPGEVPVLLKQSNIFQVQTRPFDPATHVLEGDVVVNPATGQQEVRAFDNNVVRWRWGPSGGAESNARLVRWSDGSLQVQLGGETLDVASVDMGGDNTHLCRRVPGILAFQGQLGSRLTLRPSSLDSKSHKLLAAATAVKHAKVMRVKKTLVTVDPEREKRDAELAEAQRAKDRDKLAKKQAQVARRYDLDGPSGRGSAYGGPLTAGFLEGDDDGAAPLALADRPHGKKRKAPRSTLLDDSDDDEGSWSEEEKPARGARKRAFDSDED